jgi:hypothetical protein
MIGVMYPQRWQAVHQLRSAGLKVLAGAGLIGADYVEAYRNSRVSLCISVAGDVAMRVFETAALGCVVVSDPCADFDYVQPDGIFLIENGDVVGAVREVLRDEATAERMIGQSVAWAARHTWQARARVVLEAIKESWFSE